MNINDLNKAKLPIVIIDKALEKYKTKVLFKEKLDKANEVLKTVGLPKNKYTRHPCIKIIKTLLILNVSTNYKHSLRRGR